MQQFIQIWNRKKASGNKDIKWSSTVTMIWELQFLLSMRGSSIYILSSCWCIVNIIFFIFVVFKVIN